MNAVLRRFLIFILCLSLFMPVLVRAETDGEAEPSETASPVSQTQPLPLAEDISGPSCISDYEGFPSPGFLFDGQQAWGGKSTQPYPSITITYEQGIGSLYFIYHDIPGTYTLTNNDTGAVQICGAENYLHDFLDLTVLFGTAPSSVTVTYGENPVTVNELFIYTPGQVPDTVQRWESPPEDRVDMILFATHGDDEHLFFAGLLPYYAGELDYEVLVVYLTDHRNLDGTKRMHEMLNGLWAVGITNYPVFGSFIDYKSDYPTEVYKMMERYGASKEVLLGFVVEQLRRYNPQVVVGHDFNGEYGHGQHIVYAELLSMALEISNDPQSYPDLAQQYGTWDVPKAYFHLYEQNSVVMNWDTPLERFDGLTAFQVSQQLGFPCHKSQQTTWFKNWLNRNSEASRIETYNPCLYGLYRSTVGYDTANNDLFGNLICYAEQARIKEAERLAEEAQAAEASQPASETVPHTTDAAVPAQQEISHASFPAVAIFSFIGVLVFGGALLLPVRKRK